jgi:hypothetical protein
LCVTDWDSFDVEELEQGCQGFEHLHPRKAGPVLAC